MGDGGPEASGDGRGEEGVQCAAVAGRDDDEAELDCGGIADARLDACVEFGVQATAEQDVI